MKLLSAIWLVLLVVSAETEASLIEAFLNSARSLWPVSKDIGSNEVNQLPSISFELPVEDEEFLKEGLALINAPREALDLCTHRVVATLKKNCNQLSSEEIDKLAVMMLNCQLEAEGRQTYPCKPEMTLQQCTIGMDSQIYKIYSYMAQRAVGICSALKQDQFRAMTEMTINRLTQAAQSQLTAMHEALTNQRRLNELEIANMREFNENGGKIKESQLESLEKLKHAGGLIEENLATLQQAIELRQQSEIALGDIEKTTDEISAKLSRHNADLQAGHERLLEDVDKIALSLQKSSLELIEQYNQTLEFLNNFKSLLLVLSNTAENIRNFTEKVVNTVHSAGIDLRDEFIVFMAINLAYFTSAMIFMLFADVQGTSKLILVNLFVFNTMAAYHRAEVSLLPMNIFVWLCFFAYKALSALKLRMGSIDFRLPRLSKPRRNVTPDSDSESEDDSMLERTLTPIIPAGWTRRTFDSIPSPAMISPPNGRSQQIKQEPGLRVSNCFTTRRPTISQEDSEITSFLNNGNQSGSSSSSRAPTPILSRPMTPDMRRVLRDSLPAASQQRPATPFAHGMTGRVQCVGITAKRQQCKNAAVPGTDRCRMHN